ncbi:MAG: BPTI/Kunitz-type proteinase inhibitor domain-containing protein [Phycisphaerales bacterium]|nr:BPTI/Kunitz-type proteinase inhibitor domain-containing protein [Phycisphaerales bacterium]
MTAHSAPASAQFCTHHERQKLTAPDASQEDYFGDAIAINENRILIGSPFDDAAAGAAYVFRLEDGGTPSEVGDDQWIFEQKLTAWDRAPYDYFGRSVAIGSDVAFVGTPEDDDRGFGSGSVYLFRLDTNGTPADLTDDRWIPWQKLTAWDGAAGDKFGSSAALDGDRAVVGASLDDGSEVDAGSAYVYRRHDNGTPQTPDDDYWLLETKLIPPGGGTTNRFGWDVSISTNWIVIGTPFADYSGITWAGAAYVFRREDNGTPSNPADDLWVEADGLVASDAADGFGWSVDISGSTAIVGAAWADIDMCTDTRAPCVNNDDCTTGVCDPRGNTCHRDSDCLPHEDACIQPPDYGPCDGNCSMYSFNVCTGECEIFGYGCCGGNENNFETITECQAACLSAQPVCLLSADPGIGGDQLQRFFYDPCSARCESFVYAGSGGNANNFQTLADCQSACPPSNPPPPVCPGGATCGVLTGAAYVFQFNGNAWVQQAKIFPRYGNDSGYFGAAVSIHGDRTAIGAKYGDVSLVAPGSISQSGIAFLFKRSGTMADRWDQKATLSPSDAEGFQYFGKSIAIHGEWIAIGAPLDNRPGFRAGSMYAFFANAECDEGAIPAVSAWGIVATGLGMVLAGALVLRRCTTART